MPLRSEKNKRKANSIEADEEIRTRRPPHFFTGWIAAGESARWYRPSLETYNEVAVSSQNKGLCEGRELVELTSERREHNEQFLNAYSLYTRREQPKPLLSLEVLLPRSGGSSVKRLGLHRLES